ncbi:hypothetical protein RHGRI_004059 [Rhododendron griersonianum]|uniref:ATP-dependent DNA helicase n=1 Tax=Rhododendron griersonianum TaxID=479676 RepID=A0AAV6L7H1_9ERIC|nr:hypothetical protein RHGRI_004059 [Rhododendron griersonianum]
MHADHCHSEFEIRQSRPCSFCGAKKFQYETPNFCCYGGKIVLASLCVPEVLCKLYTSQCEEGKEFRKNIRAYNSIFSFTSFAVRLDKQLATSQQGVYTFCAQGQVYHNLPSLIPSTDGSCFFQMYFYDTCNEVQNRLQILKDADLSESIVRKLMEVLSENPYAQVLHTLEKRPLESYRIHIQSSVKLDQRVYNSPSVDQVAGIWIEGNNANVPFEREIVIHEHFGVQYSSFKEASQKRGLLKSDDYISEYLHEAANFHMPNALRRLFATILIFCEPVDVMRLWYIHFESMSEDFVHGQAVVFEERVLKTVKSLDFFLESMGRSVKDFDLPIVDLTMAEDRLTEKREILDELAVTVPLEDYSAATTLNEEQLAAYDIIMDCINSEQSGIFFIDGPGGTGKTYLYRALLATIRLKHQIAIATATSGVAASLLPGSRTAHSRFKIPINGNESCLCNIPKQSGTAELLRRAKLIIWDEAPMAKRWEIEAVDRSLRDVMSNDIIFGGKSIVFGGDFRQVLPVVPRATRTETVNSSLVRSYVWPQLKKLKLTKNMRAASDLVFSDFLLRIGNGEEKTTGDEMVEIPSKMLIKIEENDNPENALISAVYPSIQQNSESAEYITKRAILAPKNETVDILNEKLITFFPSEARIFWSYDEAIDDTHNYYPEEFLNTLTPNGLPPHKLVLKRNSPIMLIRNIDPSDGLCNGTRMVCRGFDKDVIYAEIIVGQFAGKPILLPRIPLLPAENEAIPFKFKRTQFPIRLCFAMTINKAQGQTIPYVGLYLPQNVFSHGQLYVALSRGTSMATTKVLLKTGVDENKERSHTKNVVFKEVLTM